MTLLKLVFSFAFVCLVTAYPTSDTWSVPSKSVSPVTDLLRSAGTGKNWLTPYVSLLSSVIPSTETTRSVPAGAEKTTRDARSSDHVITAEPGVLPLPPQNSSVCQSFVLKHQGKKVPLIKPTTGNIYKDKSLGNEEIVAASSAARAAVAAHSVPHHGTVISLSNPPYRGHPHVDTVSPHRFNVCSTVWQREDTPAPRTETDGFIDLYFATLELPEPVTTPMTMTSTAPPKTEPVVTETCDLPPPYHDDQYDWLEILSRHGGIPGCVKSTHRPSTRTKVVDLNDTCERPLAMNSTGEVVYTYMTSDLHTYYRHETVYLRFPGRENQFFDIRGFLVWTSPSDDGNVYVLEYILDDSGLWFHLPSHTCKFVDTATLTCSTRLDCWCKGKQKICLSQHGLPGNLLATLVGGG